MQPTTQGVEWRWSSHLRGTLGLALALSGCGQPPPDAALARALAAGPPSAPPKAEPPSPEPHLKDLKQLTFGGENAEAYFSFDGKQLSLQAHQGEGCDQIYRLTPGAAPTRVSNGKGATTCAYCLPGDQELVYASTHLRARPSDVRSFNASLGTIPDYAGPTDGGGASWQLRELAVARVGSWQLTRSL